MPTDHIPLAATAEGLILTKFVAFCEQDQADIVTLLAANRADIVVGSGSTAFVPVFIRGCFHGFVADEHWLTVEYNTMRRIGNATARSLSITA